MAHHSAMAKTCAVRTKIVFNYPSRLGAWTFSPGCSPHTLQMTAGAHAHPLAYQPTSGSAARHLNMYRHPHNLHLAHLPPLHPYLAKLNE